MIKTYSDLQTAIAAEINRQDCTAQIPDWINCVHVEVQEYAGPLAAMENPTDTNNLMLYNPYIYLWGAVSQAGDFLRDTDLKELYETKYQAALNNLAMTGFAKLRPRPNTYVPRPLYGWRWGRWGWRG
jgi:hypothetical protein